MIAVHSDPSAACQLNKFGSTASPCCWHDYIRLCLILGVCLN